MIGRRNGLAPAAPILRALIAASLATLGIAFPAPAQTLAEAVSRAMVRYPELQAGLAGERAVRETVTQARAGYLPSIDLTFGRGREASDNVSTRAFGRDVTLTRGEAEASLSQLVFDAGATGEQVRRQEARSEAAAQRLANAAQTVALRTTQAYLEVLRRRALAEIAVENLRAHERTVAQMREAAERGVRRRSDLDQALARLALAHANLAGARGQVEEAEAAYRHLTGAAPGRLARPALEVRSLPQGLSEGIDLARRDHPSVRAALAELESAQAERDFSRARLAPRVSIDLGVSHNRNLDGVAGRNEDRFAMLRLRHNLFRGGADEARIAEAEARRDEAQAQLEQARIDAEREARIAWEALLTERERVEHVRQHARISRTVVEAYRDQFKLGQRTLLDVLNAESEYYSARGAEVSGEFGVLLAGKRVLAATGRLLAALGVAPPGAGGAAGR
jgi:adhesin transport system outer membrane protein